MNPLAELMGLGVDVRLAGTDRLSLGGLRQLTPDNRRRAFELAQGNKGQIVDELGQSAFPVGGNTGHASRDVASQSPFSAQAVADIGIGASAPSGASSAGNPRRCSRCVHWSALPRRCWWIGRCAIDGRTSGSRSVCTLGKVSH
jgi:hypothetical protein